ncbi:MAG: hypothetical protein Q8K07_18080, partial [Methylicorpusculum sp.]|uniref:hypothetical protein n=1 Tax=Methylicorpusculum sp. TaxID=2713644 RepID=UPI0027305D22
MHGTTVTFKDIVDTFGTFVFPAVNLAVITGLVKALRGVAIFAKACFGHPSPIKQQKNTRPLMPPAAPIRPRRLVSTQ